MTSSQIQQDMVAQMAEQLAADQKACSSNPTWVQLTFCLQCAYVKVYICGQRPLTNWATIKPGWLLCRITRQEPSGKELRSLAATSLMSNCSHLQEVAHSIEVQFVFDSFALCFLFITKLEEIWG